MNVGPSIRVRHPMPTAIAILICLAAAVSLVQLPSTHAEDRQLPAQLSGLQIVKAERTIVEGKSGIEITFDEPSAERFRRFTSNAVGRRMVFFVNQRSLATLRLLDPLTKGNVLLNG
jgi:preprotein translocase subunit SecD